MAVVATSPTRNFQSLQSSGVPIQATTAGASSLVLSANPCMFLSAFVVGNASAAGWLLVYDSATKPGDGAGQTPFAAIPVTAAGWSSTTPQFVPHPCQNGCTIVCSSTGPYTQTSQTAQFLSGQVA